MPMKGARSKVPLSGHFRWLSQCQDCFTKSGCHSRILKLETWNFAWDLVSPIHMLCKKVGFIWEHFEIMVQPNVNPASAACTMFYIFSKKSNMQYIAAHRKNPFCHFLVAEPFAFMSLQNDTCLHFIIRLNHYQAQWHKSCNISWSNKMSRII